MKISIVIPVYKVELYIESCIQSVIDQTYKDIELIIVNDKTPDASFELAKAVLARNNYPAVLIEQETNGGVSRARNAGLAVATGEFVLLVDSDDTLEPTMVAEMSEKAQIPGVDIVVCNIHRIPFNASEPHEWWDYQLKGLVDSKAAVKAILLDDERMYLWSNLYRRALFDKVKFVENVYYEDIIIQPTLWKSARKMYFIDKAFYNYFQRTGSVTNALGDLKKYNGIPACFNQITANFRQDPSVTPAMQADLAFFTHTWIRNLTLTIISASLPYAQVRPTLKKFQEYLTLANIRRLGFKQDRKLALFLLILKISPYLYWKRFSTNTLAVK